MVWCDRKWKWYYHCSWVSPKLRDCLNNYFSNYCWFQHCRTNRKTKSDCVNGSYRAVNCICTKKYAVHHGTWQFLGCCYSECNVTYWTHIMVAIVYWQSEADSMESKSEPNVWNMFQLPYMSPQVGIEYFYAVTEIKGDEHTSGEICLFQHMGLWSLSCGQPWVASLGQGVSATNWFPWLNWVRHNGSGLYQVLGGREWRDTSLIMPYIWYTTTVQG